MATSVSLSPELHLIYIHGFNSSPDSLKARFLSDYFAQRGWSEQLSIPELSHWPERAMQQLKEAVELVQSSGARVGVVGSSLGGFYATWLCQTYADTRAVLINPAVAPHRLLGAMLGPTQNFYSGERYELTQKHIEQLLSFYLPKVGQPQRLLLLQQEGDETLDYRDAVAYYAESQQIVQPGGNHGFEGFDQMLPEIINFLQNGMNEA